MKFVYLIFIILGCLKTGINAAKILEIYHMPSRSHYILASALAKGLADKGHEITLATPFNFTEDHPKIKNLYLDGITAVMDEFKPALVSLYNASFLSMAMRFNGLTDKLSDATLNSTGMQNLLKSNEKFDLIIFEAIMNEAHFGIAHHFQAPFIVVSTTGSIQTNYLTGNPAPYSFVPNFHSASRDTMTFAERLTNAAIGILAQLYLTYKIMPAQKEIYNKYFKDGPEFSEIVKNVSLILMNTHVCLDTPKPYLPNMIPIGGYHVDEPKKLPQDLQKYLDKAKEGVIYFSLGSNLKSSELPEEKLKMIMDTFRKLPYKILWKFEKENLPGKPDNVKISKWLPQNDILAHPNIKVFISHGGFLSSTEAVYRGVPIIAIPFFGDQKINSLNIISLGYGLHLPFGDLTEETLTNTLTEILTNPKYRDNMKKRSAIIHDQPLKPLDSAVFWIEHIIRHKGGQHLRSAAVDLTLVQYLLLDVAVFVSIIVGTLVVGIVLVCKTLCCRKVQSDEKKKKNSKSKRE